MRTSKSFDSKRKSDGLLKANIATPHPIAFLQHTGHAKSSSPAHKADAPEAGGAQQGKVVLLVTLCTAVIGAAFVLIRTNIRSPRQAINNAAMLRSPGHAKKRKKLNFTASPVKTHLFIGRKEAFKTLTDYFKQNPHDPKEELIKLVILPPITGDDGVGKTQLVHSVIYQYAPMYDHILWINAANKEDIKASYLQIAKEMGIPGISHKSPTQVVQSVQKSLQEKRVLYVFDNAPNLSMIEDYLQNGKVIITSKDSNKANWQSKDYDVPDPLALAPFSPEEALAFVEAMGQNGKDTDLQELIQLLPRYPLVLRQLFSNMSERNDTPQSFLAELKQQGQATYHEVLSLIVKRKLDFLQSQKNGEKLLLLVKQLACLDAKPIPLRFVLRALDKEGAQKKTQEEQEQTEDILHTLAKHGLMRQGADSMHMLSVIQGIIGNDYPLTSDQVRNLVDRYIGYCVEKVEGTSYTTENYYHQMIPHGEKLLAYVQKQLGKEDVYTAKCYRELSILYRGQGNNTIALTYGGKALSLFEKVYAPNTNHDDIASTHRHIGNVYYKQGKYKDAFEAYQTSLDMYKAVHPSSPHIDIADIYKHRGHIYYRQGQYGAAIQEYDEAVAMYQKVHSNNPHHRSIANAYNYLGNACYQQGENDTAMDAYQEALDIYKRVYSKETNHADIANAYSNLGNVYHRKGEYTQALEHYQTSLDIYKKVYGKETNHADIANAYNHLGDVYREQEKYGEALDYYQKSLKMSKEVYGDIPHPAIAHMYNSLGTFYDKQKMYDQSVVFFNQALNTLKARYKDISHPSIAHTYHKLGLSYYQQKRYTRSLKCYQTALTKLEEIYGETPHADRAAIYNHLGDVYRAQGNYGAAIDEYYTTALEMYIRIHKDTPHHPSIVHTYHKLGLSYYQQGEYKNAIKAYEKELNQLKDIYGDISHPDVARTYNHIGLAYYQQGDYVEAITRYQDALNQLKDIYGDIPHPLLTQTYNHIGLTYYQQEDNEQAIAAYQNAVNQAIEGHSETWDLALAASYEGLSKIYYTQNKFAKSVACWRKQKALQARHHKIAKHK